MIAPHATGHERAKDGTLLRVDCDHGTTWIATHYDLNLRVIQQARGSDEEVHRLAARWAQGKRPASTARGLPAGSVRVFCEMMPVP